MLDFAGRCLNVKRQPPGFPVRLLSPMPDDFDCERASGAIFQFGISSERRLRDPSRDANRLVLIILTVRTDPKRRAKPGWTLRRASAASRRAKNAERSGTTNCQKPSKTPLISAFPKPGSDALIAGRQPLSAPKRFLNSAKKSRKSRKGYRLGDLADLVTNGDEAFAAKLKAMFEEVIAEGEARGVSEEEGEGEEEAQAQGPDARAGDGQEGWW